MPCDTIIHLKPRRKITSTHSGWGRIAIGFPVGRRLDDLVLVPENGRSRIILTREGAGGRYQAYRGRHHFRTLRAGIASRRGHVDGALLRKPAFGSPGSLSIRKKWHRPARKKRWCDGPLLFRRPGASDLRSKGNADTTGCFNDFPACVGHVDRRACNPSGALLF